MRSKGMWVWRLLESVRPDRWAFCCCPLWLPPALICFPGKAQFILNKPRSKGGIYVYRTVFALSLIQWIMVWKSSRLHVRWCVTFDQGMFFIAGSSIFIFSGWLLCWTAFIQTAPSVWIARSNGLNTPKTAWNDVHQSNFVSVRDQVNFILSLTVTELLGITFFAVIYGNRVVRKESRNPEKPTENSELTPSLKYDLLKQSGSSNILNSVLHYLFISLHSLCHSLYAKPGSWLWMTWILACTGWVLCLKFWGQYQTSWKKIFQLVWSY